MHRVAQQRLFDPWDAVVDDVSNHRGDRPWMTARTAHLSHVARYQATLASIVAYGSNRSP
jgi:hypothetical protein